MFRTALALLLSLTLIAQPAAAFAHQAEYSSESKTIGVSTGVTGISPSFSPGFSAEDKASSQTLATVSPGAIITGEPTDLSGLNRDKTKAHQKLEKIFDLEALKEDAEFAEVASEVVSRATAPILKMIGEKYTDKEIDTVTHKLLHAVVGCGTGALTGGDCASGAVAAEVAVEIAVNVQTQALVAKLRKEGGEPSAKDIETISQNAQLVGKFTSLATALGLGLNEHSANLAGTNAAENNCGGGWCVAAIVSLYIYLTLEGDGNSGQGLAKIGRGEDSLSRAAAWGAGEAVELSMDAFPEQTKAVLAGLDYVSEGASAVVTYTDEATEKVVSRAWGEIPKDIRDQLKGSGKILSIFVPGSAVKALKSAKLKGKLGKKLGRTFDDLKFDKPNSSLRPGLLPTELSKAIRNYGSEVQKITGYKLTGKQGNEIKTALQNTDYSKPLSPAQHAAHRRQFNSSKDRLRSEWETSTGQKWPTYGANAPNGRKAGQPWDAHELIPNKNGGPIKWWNISPARFPDQHQAGIHGKNGAFNKLMKQIGN